MHHKPEITEVWGTMEWTCEEARDQLCKQTPGVIPEPNSQEGPQLELDDDRFILNSEPQGFNIVEPTHTIIIWGSPFDRYPQLVFPFRIHYPPLPDSLLQMWPVIFIVGVVFISLVTVGVVLTMAHITKVMELPAIR